MATFLEGAFFALFGAILGSFVTVVSARGPIQWGLVDSADGKIDVRDVHRHRSFCPACGTTLTWRDLIPLLSFMLQRGRCRYCASPISIRYPVMEGLGMLAGVTAAMVAPSPLLAALLLAIALVLLTLGAIDAETGYLPDRLTLPLIAAGFCLSLGGWSVSVIESASGAALGYGAFWALSVGYRALRGAEGLGMGDAKLLAGIGAVTGIYALPFVLLASSVAAIVHVGITQTIRGQAVHAKIEVRYGPYLAGAGAVIMMVQAAI